MTVGSVRKRKNPPDYDFWNAPEGEKLALSHRDACRDALPAGCGVATLEEGHLGPLRRLCYDISRSLRDIVPWGDGWTDNKRRGYAMLPEHSSYKSVKDIVGMGIVLHDADSSYTSDAFLQSLAVKKHQYTAAKSFTKCHPPPDQLLALHAIVEQAKRITAEQYQRGLIKKYEANCVDMANLVAIQPNIHNGDDYLPLHLDEPRHDGFGIVIVTVALWGSADIVLVDDGDLEPDSPPAGSLGEGEQDGCDPISAQAQAGAGEGSRSWSFLLQPGKMYVLSGPSRNTCAHGVVVQLDATAVPSAPPSAAPFHTSTLREEPPAVGADCAVGGLDACHPAADGNKGSDSRAEAEGRDSHGGKVQRVSSKQGKRGRGKGKGKGRGPGSSEAAQEAGQSSSWAGRVSLNLRFGLHTVEQAWEDIDRHWQP